MTSINIRAAMTALCATHVFSLFAVSAHGDVVFGNGATVFQDNTTLLVGPQTFPDDYSVPDGAGVLLFHRTSDSDITVDGGSTLAAGSFLSTFTDTGLDFIADIFVDGPGSRIQVGSESGRTGNILLRGRGDFMISNGAVVDWIDNNLCDGQDFSCDIRIGQTALSNTGIVVTGAGSLLDASMTNGRFMVGFDPSMVLGESEDFLVALDGGTILSNGGDVAAGVNMGWDPTMGFVQATALIDAGTWNIQAAAGTGNFSALDLGEGSGATANMFIVNGGTVAVTGNPGQEGGFYLGQTDVGVPTEGGTNLLGVRGAGSRLTVDNNSGQLTGSRIANGFVTVQENGVLELDSSLLLVSGKSGQVLTTYNTMIALGPAGFTTLGSANLDVRTGGSVMLTDNDAVGFSALIIGQTPDAGPTQSADVEIASGGSVAVINDPALPKIPLDATDFGIPVVSNIGTGSLMISDGTLTFDNGDFVIGVELEDSAQVTVAGGGVLAAERVIVGWADYEAGGPGINATATGDLVLTGGTVNGDVIVDDNGILAGSGNVNGDVFAEGGLVDPGASPGTITVHSFHLGANSQLVMELALNTDGSIDTSVSDAIVATTGGIDLSGGSVTFELSSTDPGTSVDDIVGGGEEILVTQVFESMAEVTLADFVLTDPSGSISDEQLEQVVTVSLDNDGDGLSDDADNCRLDANPGQLDTNGDGIGNICDADFDNNCVVNAIDLGLLKAAFFSTPASGNWNADADMTGDSVVNAQDLGRLKSRFFQNLSVDNPSGIANICVP